MFDGMSPAAAFSLMVILEGVLLTLACAIFSAAGRNLVILEHARVFLFFSLLTIAFIALRQASGTELAWYLALVLVLWEDTQKGYASRIFHIDPISASVIFAATELSVVKANLILPTPGYLGHITEENWYTEGLVALAPALFHISTGVIYFLLRSWPLPVTILICSALHILFNAVIS